MSPHSHNLLFLKQLLRNNIYNNLLLITIVTYYHVFTIKSIIIVIIFLKAISTLFVFFVHIIVTIDIDRYTLVNTIIVKGWCSMENTSDIQIGEQIRYYRRKNGISQETLALIADLNPAYIGQIERGIKSPTINTLKKIADALGVSLATLFTPIADEKEHLSEIRRYETEKIMLSINRLNDNELILLSQIITHMINFRKLP